MATLLDILPVSKEECAVLNFYVDNIENYSSSLQDNDNSVEYGFDRDPSSLWKQTWPEDSGMTSWALLDFVNTYISFDKISVIPYYNHVDSPLSINVTGYRDDKELITSYTYKYTYDSSSEIDYKNLHDSFTLISSLLINITEKYDDTAFPYEMRAYDIGLHLCSVNYCKGVGSIIPKTPENMTLYLQCQKNPLRNDTITCQQDEKGNYYFIESNSECEDDINILYYEKEYVLINGENYNDFRLISAYGSKITYTIEPRIYYLYI